MKKLIVLIYRKIIQIGRRIKEQLGESSKTN